MPPLSSKTDKPKDTKGTLLRLLSYLGRYRLGIFGGVLLSVAANGMSLIGPELAGLAISAMEGGKGNVAFRLVYRYATLMLILYICSSVITYLLSFLMMNIGRSVGKKLRSDVMNKLMRLPVGYFDTHQTGDIISRVSYDIDVISTARTSGGQITSIMMNAPMTVIKLDRICTTSVESELLMTSMS